MSASRVVVRPATREDFAAFDGRTPEHTAWAVAGVVDGRVIGLGGFMRRQGWLFAFCDLTPEARKYKVTMVKTARRILDEARKSGRRYIYAIADPDEPGAERWLQSLGFEPVGEGMFKWRA